MMVVPCPRIVTYEGTEAPAAHRWMAWFFVPVKVTDKNPKGGERRLPMFFEAATEEAASSKARTWWADQQAREEQRKAAAEKRAADRKKEAA